MTDTQQWMVDQIKIEANAVRQQIKGLPDDMRDRLTREVIDILGVKGSENRNWIRCRDRLPDKDGEYLVTCKYHNGNRHVVELMFSVVGNDKDDIPKGWYDFDGYTYGIDEVDGPDFARITHWMPIPEPPTDDTQKGDR